jgi:hypothetical protein
VYWGNFNVVWFPREKSSDSRKTLAMGISRISSLNRAFWISCLKGAFYLVK